MPLKPTAAQMVWGAVSLGAWWTFRRALGHPRAAQARILREYLQANRETAFGREHRFDRIGSIEEFQRRVPIRGYDELEPLIQRVADGEPGVLTREPVHRLAPSSGSTSAAKLIPYTRRLQREMSRAVDPWIVDLHLRRRRVLGGPAYWSITPPSPPRGMPPSVIPIGFDDDSRYLGGAREALARATMIVPPLADDVHGDRFRHATLGALLFARELRLVSIWHPSFLTLMLDVMARDWDVLVDAIARVDRRRGSELRRASPADVRSIWPRLTLVSCWGDGPAARHANALADRLAGIEVQRKGLIATEGVVTVPFGRRHPIAIRSHFFEFLDPDGRARLADELEPDVDYHVVLTTGGGLYRYRIGDRVRVDGCVDSTPSLTFVGRDDRVSDRYGEKLSDAFVAGVIETVFTGTERPQFAMLAPDETPAGVAYTLFVDRDAARRRDLSVALERELRRNPHYAWCVDLGQLRPAAVAAVGPGADRAYVEACVARGQRLGDVKPVSLDGSAGWRSVLPC
jgi:hypothetical protein